MKHFERGLFSLIILLFLLFLNKASAQELKKAHFKEEKQEIIEKLIEYATEVLDVEEIEYNEFYDDLLSLLENPINLNTTNEEELKKLLILNDFQIQNLIDYRKEYGEFLSIYELKNIEGFNDYIISLILPFVTIERPKSLPEFNINEMKKSRNSIILKTKQILQEKEGYKINKEDNNKGYLGSPYKLYARYSYKYKNNFFFGFTCEKDEGEEFFKGSQKNGFDFYSGYLSLKEYGAIKTLIIGDYLAQFGQGLILWNGFSINKSSLISNMKKKGIGLKNYTSTDENRFFRGIGSTINYKNFYVTSFISYKKIDGNITNIDTLEEENIISSFLISGLHRTINEINNKKVVKEKIYGTNFTYNFKFGKIGINSILYKFSLPVYKKNFPYNYFAFSGKKGFNASCDYNVLLYKKTILFGEIGISANKGIGTINGLCLMMDDHVNFLIIYRNFDKTFYSLYGQTIFENTMPSNERGILIGTELPLSKQININAYYDMFYFPWLKYLVSSPSYGTDYLIELIYLPFMKHKIVLRYKSKSKQKDISSNDNFYEYKYLVDETKRNFRITYEYEPNEKITLKSRIEYLCYQKFPLREKGIYIFQDFIYTFLKIPLKIYLRYGIFDTDGYNSKIYAYENDILYSFSIPFVYHKGSRFYITIKYQLSKNISLWFNYNETFYFNKKQISTGLEQINNNVKSEIKFLLKVNF